MCGEGVGYRSELSICWFSRGVNFFQVTGQVDEYLRRKSR